MDVGWLGCGVSPCESPWDGDRDTLLLWTSAANERSFWLTPTPRTPPPCVGATVWPCPPGQGCLQVSLVSPLPGQGGQQAAGSAGGSAQDWGQSLFSQLTSPSWGAKAGSATPSRSPLSPHRSPRHLAGAAGTGLSLGGEALPIHHLPTLVVAVWGVQSTTQPGAGGSQGAGTGSHGSPLGSYRYRRGSTRPRGGRGRCRRWHSPRASRPPSPAARETQGRQSPPGVGKR